MALNLPATSESIPEPSPSGSSDAGETAVVRVTPSTDESSDEVDVRAFSRVRVPSDISVWQRFKLQYSMWGDHYQLFRAEYQMITIYLTIPVIASSSGFIMQSLFDSSIFSRMFLELGAMLYFGIWVAYWKGIPDGPPCFATEDGAPKHPRYIKDRIKKYYSQLDVTTVIAAPPPGQSQPSDEPKPGPSRLREEPQPGPSQEPQHM